MKRWLFILTLFLFFFPTIHVYAQESTPQISEMSVDILPEYDRPETLVIYRIILDANVGLPADIKIRIPLQAGEPYNVAVRDSDGQLYIQDYQQEIDGEWLVLSLNTPLPELQIEYYDPRISRQGTTRTLQYEWPKYLAVDNLTISVYQPLNATNMKMTPDMGTGRQNSSNLSEYSLILGRMESGSAFQLDISYDKTDNALSGPAQPVEPSAPISEKTTGWVTLQEVLPWLLGGLGVLLIGGAAFFYWRSGLEFSTPSFRRRHGPTNDEKTGEEEGGVFCHKCGRRASSGDVFCRTCGTKLRIE